MPGRVTVQRLLYSRVWLAGLLLIAGGLLADVLEISDQVRAFVRQNWGDSAVRRVVDWGALAESVKDMPEKDKLVRINDFLNRTPFVSDQSHWRKEDYWATPVELLGSNGGDCEDFAIAKYFTLRAVGVPASRMRITYVKALRLNQAHMVLTYFPQPDADPLVLDNLIGGILPASERTDLAPVYSFNAEGLWIARMRGAGIRVGKGEDVNLWMDLLRRMQGMPGAQSQ